MKRGIRLNFNFSNRVLYSLITLFVLAIVGVGVYAVAGTTPNPGHSLAGLQLCTAGQTLVMNSDGTAWTCAVAGSGGGSSNPFIIQDLFSAIRMTTANGVNYIQSGVNPTTADSKADIQFTSINGVTPWMTIKGDTGNVGIGTESPASKLSVRGGVILLRDSSTSTTPGIGPSLTLQSPSNNVSTLKGTPDLCDTVGECSVDDTLTHDLNLEYSCLSGSGGTRYDNDVYKDIANNNWHQKINCVAGTESYSLRVNNGALEFVGGTEDFKSIVGYSRFVEFRFASPTPWSWKVPVGVHAIRLLIVGGGSGGYGAVNDGAPGGGAGNVDEVTRPVNPGDVLGIVVGKGGAPGIGYAGPGPGEPTSVKLETSSISSSSPYYKWKIRVEGSEISNPPSDSSFNSAVRGYAHGGGNGATGGGAVIANGGEGGVCRLGGEAKPIVQNDANYPGSGGGGGCRWDFYQGSGGYGGPGYVRISW